MRYIYLDEAGTSAQEPVTVVAGIILDADAHYTKAERRLEELLRSMPAPWGQSTEFVPHAKSIFHGEDGMREAWPDFAARRKLIRDMIAIAPQLGIAVSIGFCRRTVPFAADLPGNSGVTLVDHCHMLAFGLCIAHADRFICAVARRREVATLVAEDIPERKRLLDRVFDQLMQQSLSLDMHHGTQKGLDTVKRVDFRITRIRDQTHFVAKPKSYLLWIADACAFAYARFFSGRSFGEELIEPIRARNFEQHALHQSPHAGSLVIGQWPTFSATIQF